MKMEKLLLLVGLEEIKQQLKIKDKVLSIMVLENK